jgi:hypothetical protein
VEFEAIRGGERYEGGWCGSVGCGGGSGDGLGVGSGCAFVFCVVDGHDELSGG